MYSLQCTCGSVGVCVPPVGNHCLRVSWKASLTKNQPEMLIFIQQFRYYLHTSFPYYLKKQNHRFGRKERSYLTLFKLSLSYKCFLFIFGSTCSTLGRALFGFHRTLVSLWPSLVCHHLSGPKALLSHHPNPGNRRLKDAITSFIYLWLFLQVFDHIWWNRQNVGFA